MDSKLKKQIGKNIKTARKFRNLTQEDLAKHLSITRSSLGNVEIGAHSINLSDLLIIAKVTDFDLNLFINNESKNISFPIFSKNKISTMYDKTFGVSKITKLMKKDILDFVYECLNIKNN